MKPSLVILAFACWMSISRAEPIQLNKKEAVGAAADTCAGAIDSVNTVKAISDCDRMVSASSCGLTGRLLHGGTAMAGRSAQKQFSKFIASQNESIRKELAKTLGDDYHEAWRKSYAKNAASEMVTYKGKEMSRAAKETAVLAENPGALRGKVTGPPNMKFSGDIGKWVDIASYSTQELEKLGAKDLAGRNTNAGISTMEKVFELHESGRLNLKDPKVMDEIAEANHKRWLQIATDKDPSWDKAWKELSPTQRQHNIEQVKSITDRFRSPISRSLGKGSAAIVYSSATSGKLGTKALMAIGKKAALGLTSLGVGVAVEAISSATPTGCATLDEAMVQTDANCKPVLVAGPKVDDFLSQDPKFQKQMLKRPAVCKFYNDLADKMLNREKRKAELAKSLGACSDNQIDLVDGGAKVKYSFSARGAVKDVTVQTGQSTQQFKLDNGEVRVRSKVGTRWTSYRDVADVDSTNVAYKKPLEYLSVATAAAAKRSKGCSGEEGSSSAALEEAR